MSSVAAGTTVAVDQQPQNTRLSRPAGVLAEPTSRCKPLSAITLLHRRQQRPLHLLQKGIHSVLAAIQQLRQQLPFPLRGIDVDNDTYFMNALILPSVPSQCVLV